MKSQFARRSLVALIALTVAGAAGPLPAQSRTSPPSKTGSSKAGSSKSAAGKDAAAQRDLALERELLKATKKVQSSYLGDLERIAAWAAANGLQPEAKALVADMRRIDPEHDGLDKLEAKVTASKAEAKDAEAARKSLGKRVETAKDAQARRLFDLAKRCMQFGLFTRAYQLVKSVVEADPDHKQARGILGQVWDAKAKTWISKWEADMRKTHYLTEEGWVPLKDRAKWEKGQRPYLGKWVTKEEEARIRARNVHSPYVVETEHFAVKTNLGREKAYEFARRLEDFYRIFFEFFIGFYDQTASAKLLFNVQKTAKKHQVLVFPTRVEYLDFVRSEKGNDELLIRSGGFWSSGDMQSFFFWTEDSAESLNTLYHETTHQLFGETKTDYGHSTGNNWIVEGVAVYIETCETVGGKWRPGYRIDSPSLQGVKRFLAANPGWSLAAFAAVGHKEFHEPQARGLNYALGGALTHFFLHHGDEIYREDYIALLRGYYEGKLRADSLGEYIRVEGVDSPSERVSILEKQFKEYMEKIERPGEDSAIVASTVLPAAPAAPAAPAVPKSAVPKPTQGGS